MALVPGRADASLQPLFPDGFHAVGLVDVVKFSRAESYRNDRTVDIPSSVHRHGNPRIPVNMERRAGTVGSASA